MQGKWQVIPRTAYMLDGLLTQKKILHKVSNDTCRQRQKCRNAT